MRTWRLRRRRGAAKLYQFIMQRAVCCWFASDDDGFAQGGRVQLAYKRKRWPHAEKKKKKEGKENAPCGWIIIPGEREINILRGNYLIHQNLI